MRHGGSAFLGIVIAMASACTTLGPMPTTTGMSAVAAGRPAVDIQAGTVPAYFLSAAVHDPKGATVGQSAILAEPDRYLHTKGLVIGGRIFGPGHDSMLEPIIGFRKALDEQFSVGAFVFGTSNRGSDRLATYHGFRAGAELAADGRIAELTRWLGLHAQGAVDLTRVVASGRYCIDVPSGLGQDCDEDNPENNTFVTARIRGLYPTATATVALDFGRTGTRIFKSARLAAMFSGGLMPAVIGGIQADSRAFFAAGLALTATFGAQ